MTGFLKRGTLPFAVALLTACAGNQAPEELDPIIVPENAVAVDSVNLFHAGEFSELNDRMSVLWQGNDPYLFVFNMPCRALGKFDEVLAMRTTGNQVYARFDSITPRDGAPCRIDSMYKIQREDVKQLKEAVGR